jgi:hypothetical protein
VDANVPDKYDTIIIDPPATAGPHLFDILLRLKTEGILSVSMSGGDCRFAVPPNPGMVRIRVGFMDCRESSEVRTAGAESATSQPQPQLPPPGLLSSVMFGLPTLFLP